MTNPNQSNELFEPRPLIDSRTAVQVILSIACIVAGLSGTCSGSDEAAEAVHESADSTSSERKEGASKGVRKEVKYVIDGDTFKVCKGKSDNCDRNGQESIRIKGIECPESWEGPCSGKPNPKECLAQVPLGKKAKDKAKKILKEGTVVTLIPTGRGGQFETGGKGRRLAYVDMPNGSDFGLTMIQKGLCRNYDMFRHGREKRYKAAQKKAGVFK